MITLSENNANSEVLKNVHGGINFTGPDRDVENRESRTTKEKATVAACLGAAIPSKVQPAFGVACAVLSTS